MEFINELNQNILLLPFGFVALLIFLSHRNTKHRRNIRKADRYIKKLKLINNEKLVFGYLRKVDPFVFEEMILSALKLQGHRVKRNSKYTGDGGVDGRVCIKGEKYLVQAKRYKGHINLQHVKDFIRICEKAKCKGLFIHTGKTGKESRSVGTNSNRLDIVSGNRVLHIILDKNFKVRI